MNTFKISAGIALAFFSIGTILFLLQIVSTDMSFLPIVGLYYVIAAVLLKCILVLALVVKIIIHNEKMQTLKSIGVVLANIPIAAIYIYILFEYTFI